jgi:hypothetical protein
LVKTEPGSGKA